MVPKIYRDLSALGAGGPNEKSVEPIDYSKGLLKHPKSSIKGSCKEAHPNEKKLMPWIFDHEGLIRMEKSQ